MKHCFVIPVYKESDYLEDCIKSLLNQNVKSPVILTTANDTAFVRQLSQKYDLPLIINPDGNQIGKDWNFALEQAEADLVTLAHQDDIYLKNYTEAILEAFENNPQAAIAHTNYHEIREDRVVPDNLNLKIKRLLLYPGKVLNNHLGQEAAVRFGCAICCPSVTYNKAVLKDFKFDETLKSNLDWLAWVDLHRNGYTFNYLPKTLMLHRIHPESETSKQIEDAHRQNEDMVVFEKLWPKPVARFIEGFYKKSEKRNNE